MRVRYPGVMLGAPTPRAILESDPYQRWARKAEQLGVTAVNIYRALAYGDPSEVRMLLIGYYAPGQPHEQLALLRGDSVDILVLVSDGRRKAIVHVDQLRYPVGEVVRSNPAGMIDGEEVRVAALRELAEEVGAGLKWGELIDLSGWLFGNPKLYVSPGATDETVVFGVCETITTPEGFDALDGRVTGLAHEGEHLTLHLTPLGSKVETLRGLKIDDDSQADLKATSSLLLYFLYLEVHA